MSDGPGIGRAIVLRQIACIQERIRSAENVRRTAQLDKIASQERTARAGGAALSRAADRGFAEVLAMATRRNEPISARNSANWRPVGQRSHLLRSLSESTMPSRSTALNALWDGDTTVIEELPFADLIMSTAKKHGMNPGLVAAVMKAESSFDPQAISRAGAKGLMQLMDGTARSLGVSNVFDPAQNIEGGVKFLSSLLQRYSGNTSLALAAYNAGPGAVDKYSGIPPYKETRDYVSKVLSYLQQFEESGASA